MTPASSSSTSAAADGTTPNVFDNMLAELRRDDGLVEVGGDGGSVSSVGGVSFSSTVDGANGLGGVVGEFCIQVFVDDVVIYRGVRSGFRGGLPPLVRRGGRNVGGSMQERLPHGEGLPLHHLLEPGALGGWHGQRRVYEAREEAEGNNREEETWSPPLILPRHITYFTRLERQWVQVWRAYREAAIQWGRALLRRRRNGGSGPQPWAGVALNEGREVQEGGQSRRL